MTPRSRHRAFGVLKHMSKRELRALVGAEDPASSSPEPETEGEPEGSEEGHAEAVRDLRWWAQLSGHGLGRAIWRSSSSVVLHSDASTKA